MTKSRKLTAYKHRFDGPVKWKIRHDKRAVYHKIEVVEMVDTPDGEMLAVRISHNVELANPDVDVAVLVGQAIVYRRHSKVLDPLSPELWFWNDKFWVKARAGDGTPYYNDKRYLLYEVEVDEPDKLVGQLSTGYDAE